MWVHVKLLDSMRLSLALFQHVALATAILSAIVCFSGCSKLNLSRSHEIPPEDALKQFYSNDGPEDTLMDPLILAGDKVVPLVLSEIKNKSMARRRYAIGFLGNGSYKQALPTLQIILGDSSEQDYIRGDALQASYMIDESQGRRFAQKYSDRQDYLGGISRRVAGGDPQLNKRRTYAEALAGRHQ